MHGYAFNVNTDLTYFGRIIPCGIFHRGVTSLEELLGRTIDISGVRKILSDKFAEVFQTEIESVDCGKFFEKYHIVMEKEHAPA